MTRRQEEPTSQQVGAWETPASQSESYRLSLSGQRWWKSGPSDDQKHERMVSSPRTAPTVGAKSDQQVNICSFDVRCDRMWPSNVPYIQF